MANETDKYVEGVDYKIIDKGGYKTRKFFTKAEKEALKAPKATAPVKTKTPNKTKKDSKPSVMSESPTMTTPSIPKDPTIKRNNSLVVKAKGGVNTGVSAQSGIGAKAKSEGSLSPNASTKAKATLVTATVKPLSNPISTASASLGRLIGKTLKEGNARVVAGMTRKDSKKIATKNPRGYAKGGMTKKGKC